MATDKNVVALVERYIGGESMQVLGKEHGVTRRTIYRWILSGVGDEVYGDVVTDALIARIAEADDKLEAAADKVEVAKYREMARFARMDFERRRPALYGQKQEMRHTGNAPAFTVVLLDSPSGGRVVDGSPVALPAPAGGELDLNEGASDGKQL